MTGTIARPEPATETERVILKLEDVLVLPEGTTVDDLVHADKATLAGLLEGGALTRAWREVGSRAGTKEGSIEAYAGKPGTPEARPGVFKSVPSKSWSGGLIYERPPETKVERRRLED